MKAISATGLVAGYGRSPVLHELSFSVEEGEAVIVLGPNGAGKTTLLKALTGIIPFSGSLELFDRRYDSVKPEILVRRGLVHVPEGRGTFKNLTVDENLRLGAYARSDATSIAKDRNTWLTTFPRLAERLTQPAGTLSGGEQQMLAIARAFMSSPRTVLLDEPSLGLAPNTSEAIYAVLNDIKAQGKTTMFVVEQNTSLALNLADRGLVMEAGRIAASGNARSFQDDPELRRIYLGT